MVEAQKHTNCDLTKKISAILQENPSVMVRNIAKDLQVSEEQVTRALPEPTRMKVSGLEFISIWEEVTTWEKVTFMTESPGAILEISGKLPKGKVMHGMYNLMDKQFALGGHILLEEIASIWFVSKPVFGLESHSLQFFNAHGNSCFSLYLGRETNKELIASVKTAFFVLWEKYTQAKEKTQ